jgi:hypothetical protein
MACYDGFRVKSCRMKNGRAIDHGWLLCFQGGSATTDASSELPSDNYTIRLFNPYVFINHR